MTKNRIVFFLAAFTLLSGCKQDSSKNKNIFYWNIAAGFTSLDPAFAKTQSNIWLVNQVFNTLIELDDSLKIKPGLAKAWAISADGRKYIFHLRNDVYFHDDDIFPGGKGRKLVAADIVYSFNRILNPV